MAAPSLKEIIRRIFSSLIKRPVQNFNLENRALKALDSKEIRPAPRHASTKAQMEILAQNNQPFLEEQTRKPVDLLERLKSVKVSNENTGEENVQQSSKRNLPQNRDPQKKEDMGIFEPTNLPVGKVTLRQLVDILTKHQVEPEEWTSVRISKEYKLDQNLVEKLLDNFKIFKVYLPKKEEADVTKEIKKIAAKMTGREV